jgi:aubergine-like protein
VRDPKQPLLVSRPKDRDRRGGMTGPILLVPELCFMTGLTDEQRSDFRLTSSLSQWTRMEPNKRVESLVQLSNRLTKVPSVVQELLSWNMKFSPKLLEMKGRQLQPETVILKTKVNYSANNADWTREVQRGLFNPANITKW